MMTETLDEIDRIHDHEPQRAAVALRAIDASALPAGRLPRLAFLLLHVLGEKLGAWDEASDRLEQLRQGRPDAPLAVTAQAAAAGHLAGRGDGAALAALRSAGGEAAAQTLVALSALAFRPPTDHATLAAELARLAAASESLDAGGPLNRRLAVGFNNTTSQLLDLAPPPVDATTQAALLAGSAAALHFWQAAGTWVNVERALYLRALVHNRIGDAVAARDDCNRALDLIAANGREEVDEAFLLLQLAAALARSGEADEGRRRLELARRIAAGWDDAGLKSWFAQEHEKLFGPEEKST